MAAAAASPLPGDGRSPGRFLCEKGAATAAAAAAGFLTSVGRAKVKRPENREKFRLN